jgi:hypothetical protein
LEKQIDKTEVSEGITQLKNSKAPGWDNVTAEHIKYGGEALLDAITCLFNGMVQKEFIPKHLKIGIIIPIPKGDKDCTIMGNNRGITLLPVIAKLFEKVLLQRHVGWAADNDPLDSLQGAAQAQCSCIHTSLLLQETIAYNLERDSTVYVSMLDIQKAFDTVWTEGLFYKLFLDGMDPKLWRLLQQCYDGFECKVQIDGEVSDGFEAGRGVHQGAPWSMYLFTKYFNELIAVLRSSGVAARIEHLTTGSPTYADDLAIICLHKPHMQKLLNSAFSYSQRWRFNFNPDKCAILVFGKDMCPSYTLKLGGVAIPVKKAEVHMGVLLTRDAESEQSFIRGKINGAVRAFFAIQRLGSRTVPVSIPVMSKLYWSNCMSRMAYGLEVTQLSESSMHSLEQAHGNIAKLAQALPKQTANAGCLATLGWKSMSTHIDTLRLLFLWRILLLPMHNIYKRLTLMRLCYHLYHPTGLHLGPLSVIVNAYNKYGLLSVLDNALKTGVCMNISRFKTLVYAETMNLEKKCFTVTCQLFKSLRMYESCITDVEMWSWWKFAHHFPQYLIKVRVLCRMLVEQNCLQTVVSRFDGSSPLCKMCDSREVETVCHMLFICEHWSLIRERMWQKVQESAPQALRLELDNMCSKEKTVFILSGLKCQFTAEWSDLYINLIDFCYELYTKRREQQLDNK